MRTDGRIEGGLGYPDGQIFISAAELRATSGTATLTRNASGSFSLNLGNSQTAVLFADLSKVILRYGSQPWVQEQFGSALAGGAQGLPVGGYTAVVTANALAGTNVNVAVGSSANFTVGRAVNAGTQKTFITAIPDATHITLATLTATLTAGLFITENIFTTPTSVNGVPPFTGSSQLSPASAATPKGIKIRQLYPDYAVAGAALTLNTIGVTQTVFANNVAPAVTVILANAANGLATATNAQPYLTPIMIPSPSYLTTKFADFVIEWDVTTAGGGTAQLFGIYVDIEFLYV